MKALRDLIQGRDVRAASRAFDPVPAQISRRLIPQNPDEPLYPKFREYRKGPPGVHEVREGWWVIRDERGRLVGGAILGDMGDTHPPTR